MAERSPLTGYESNSLIEISSGQQEVDPTKFGSFKSECSCGNMSLSEVEFSAMTTSMRQVGVGTPGGAEALAIFHQLLYDEWITGACSVSLARIKVDEKKCFGMIEWKAVREAASQFFLKHTTAGAWKHRNLSHVEQKGLPPMPKDRRAEQGNVDGSLECSLALAAGSLPWIGVADIQNCSN